MKCHSCKKVVCGLILDGDKYVCGLCVISQRNQWKEIAMSLHDGDPCHYDHHGYCQSHNLHERPCPHEQMKELLNG